MRENRLVAMKAAGTPAVNGWLSVGSGYQAELLGHAGFDAVTVDLQHGPFGFDAAVQMLQALSSTPAVPLARSAGGTLAEINKLLDAGAYGVICPLIDSVDEAAAFARACRYPPRGARSFGPARGLTYGGADYAAHADDHVLSLAMVETVQALECIEAIAQVQELSGIYVGPSDLGLSMGLGASAWPHPQLVQAIGHVRDVCHARGKYIGIFSSGPAMDAALLAMGFDLITPGNDAQQLRAGAQQRIQGLRQA